MNVRLYIIVFYLHSQPGWGKKEKKSVKKITNKNKNKNKNTTGGARARLPATPFPLSSHPAPFLLPLLILLILL